MPVPIVTHTKSEHSVAFPLNFSAKATHFPSFSTEVFSPVFSSIILVIHFPSIHLIA